MITSIYLHHQTELTHIKVCYIIAYNTLSREINAVEFILMHLQPEYYFCQIHFLPVFTSITFQLPVSRNIRIFILLYPMTIYDERHLILQFFSNNNSSCKFNGIVENFFYPIFTTFYLFIKNYLYFCNVNDFCVERIPLWKQIRNPYFQIPSGQACGK